MRHLLSRIRPRRKAAARPQASSLRLHLAALGLGLAALLASFMLGFPADAVKDRLVQVIRQQAGIQVEIGRLAWRLPVGLGLQQVRIHQATPLGEVLELERLTLRPLWSSLLKGEPGLAASGRLLDGALHASWRRDGRLQAELTGQQLQLTDLGGTGLSLSGQLGSLRYSGPWPPQRETPADISAHLERLSLNGLAALGLPDEPLGLGQLNLDALGQGQRLTVNELRCEGGAVTLSGNGTLLLADPLDNSRLGLSLNLQPGAQLPKPLRELISLAAKPDRAGNFRMRLTGTLARPVLR